MRSDSETKSVMPPDSPKGLISHPQCEEPKNLKPLESTIPSHLDIHHVIHFKFSTASQF